MEVLIMSTTSRVTLAMQSTVVEVLEVHNQQLTSGTDTLQGILPYTPTRLEWLAVEMNAYHRQQLTAEHPYMVTFVPLINDDTILIHVYYARSSDPVALNMALNGARKVLDITLHAKGWAGWVKVREQLVMHQERRQDQDR
jgi:hypothetical protein